MKVTNHQKGNFHYCGTDSSVMYGSVFMTRKELSVVSEWLKIRYEHAKQNGETYQRDSLAHLLARGVVVPKKGEPFCIGVEPTRLMFEAFGLKGYKKQNYSITVTD